MKGSIKFSIIITLFTAFYNISCEKEKSCEGCATKNNKQPIAVAGPDQVITLPIDSVLLDGSSSSDPDGKINEWLWTKISGPVSFNIIKPTDSITRVKTLVVGTYQFELKVTDNGGLFAKDTMRIIVDSVVITNHPPIANAGTDQTITLPNNTVSLDGRASTDPENNITNYLWTKISGPSSYNIVNSNAVQTQVTTLVQGIYQFELKVTDALGLFSKDTIQVIVNAAVSNNLPPVAIGGNDTTIQTNQTSCTPVPITITLNGNNSYDPDGSISNYLWIGPNGIANPNSAITTINGIFQGTISVILKVTDNNGAVGYDTIRISILPANRPLIPAQLIPIGTLSQARSSVVIGAAGNKILFAGGNGTSAVCASSRVDIYDVSTNLWTIAELSQARFGMGTASLGNKIFFGGGFTPQFSPNSTTCFISNWENTRSSAIDVYDASTNTWSTAQLNAPRSPEGASAENKIIFAGGDAWGPPAYPSNKTDIYNSSTDLWTSGALSEVKGLPQIATADNKIFLAGGAAILDGDYFNGITKRIDIYDAVTGQWSVDFLSIERTSMGSIGANNKIYWGGGVVANPDPNIVYEPTSLVEIRDLTTNTTTFDCLSEPREQLTAIRKDNKVIFFGKNNVTRFDIYDLTTNSWSIGVLPQSFYSASVISYNNIIYMVGSHTSGVLSNQVWKLEF